MNNASKITIPSRFGTVVLKVSFMLDWIGVFFVFVINNVNVISTVHFIFGFKKKFVVREER